MATTEDCLPCRTRAGETTKLIDFTVDLDRGSAWISYGLLRGRRSPERFGNGRPYLTADELAEYEAFTSDRLASAGESHLLRVDGTRATIVDADYRVTSLEPFEPVTVDDPLRNEGERRLELADEGPTPIPEGHAYELDLPELAGGELVEIRLPGDYKPYGGHWFSPPDGLVVDGCVGASIGEDGLVLDSMAAKTLLVGLRAAGDDLVADPGVALADRLRGTDPAGEPAALDGEALLDRLIDADVVTATDSAISLSPSYRACHESVRDEVLPLTVEAIEAAAEAAAAGGASYSRLSEQLLAGERVTEADVGRLLALARHGVADELMLAAANALEAFD